MQQSSQKLTVVLLVRKLQSSVRPEGKCTRYQTLSVRRFAPHYRPVA
jgi:hypothetical protein